MAGHKTGGRIRASLQKVSPKITSAGEKCWSIAILLVMWLFEVSAFVLLPLVIYAVTFLCLGKSAWEALNSPEAMLVTTILYGEVLRKQVLFYKDYQGFDLKFSWVLACSVLGMTISSVLLCFSLISQESQKLPLSNFFMYLKYCAFGCALVLSAIEKITTGFEKGEHLTYSGLKPVRDASSSEDG